MSTKKLIRYLKETNAMFNQEDLKITHQLIQDEVRFSSFVPISTLGFPTKKTGPAMPG